MSYNTQTLWKKIKSVISDRLYLTSFLLSAAFLLCVGIGLISYDWISSREPQAINDEVVGSVDTHKENEPFNVLLLGCDVSKIRTDTIMMINVDPEAKTIRFLSIPRDTKIRIYGNYQKINASVPLGGYDLLFKNLKEITGAPIHYYVSISPGTFAKIVDALGGVEYNVEQNMYYSDPKQGLYINLKKGQQTLNGNQAEQYCRFRRYAMGDITRTEHQQKFLVELLKQKLQLQYITKIPDIFDVIREDIKTNITPVTVLDNLEIAKMFAGGSVAMETVETPGHYNDMHVEGISYYLIDKEKVLEICKDKFLGSGESGK